jgi:chemosensory pili system protein ChpA (sensor histidine kinase/response regulator)
MSRVILESQRTTLEAASVELLNPLVEPDSNWAQDLAQRLQACADVAQSLKLVGFAKLAGHIGRCLNRGKPNQKDQEPARQWASSAIAFCSGQLSGQSVDVLLDQIPAWRLVAKLSNKSALEKLRERLRREAARVSSGEVEPVRAPRAPTRITVAQDELQMMSEACNAIGKELSNPSLLGDDGAHHGIVSDISNLGNALSVLGLPGQGTLFMQVSAAVETRLGNASERAATIDLLKRWTGAWVQWFAQPASGTLANALDAHQDVNPGTSTAQRAQAQEELESIELIQSRKVERPDEAIDDDDLLSLSIPADADQEVVEQLLRELPMLTTQFANALSDVKSGNVDELANARRIAHTIKGAANTVGVRGVARLTHVLEDGLQLLADGNEPLTDTQLGVLSDSADCLADMVDAVCGIGPPPKQASQVYSGLSVMVTDLISQSESPDQGHDAPSASEPELPPDAGTALSLSDFELPDLDLSSEPKSISVDSPRALPDSDTVQPVAAKTPVADSPPTEKSQGQIRVSANAVDALLDSASEAVVTVAQLRELLGEMQTLRDQWQIDAERLSQLAAQLDRLVDTAPVQDADSEAEMDPLELERFGDLHMTSRRISEVGADGKLLDQQLSRRVSTLSDLVGRLDLTQADLRERALTIRMVHASSVEPRFLRVARQAARAAGKLAELKVLGGETAIDSDLLQRLVEPISHLIRNAIDHGFEAEGDRVAMGKAQTGKITIEFARESGSVNIDIRDDGAGLNVSAIERRAQELNLIPAGGQLDEPAAAQLILAPGFSTRQQATQLSGRGIGLDVVNQALRGMRGEMLIDSVAKQGTTVKLSVPMRVSSVPVFVVRSPAYLVAPSIRGIERIIGGSALLEQMQGEDRIRYNDRLLEVRHLDEALGLPPGLLDPEHIAGVEQDWVVALVQTAGGAMTGLKMPDPGQTRQVVVRASPVAMPHIPGIDGFAILGDGAVAPVIDLPELITTSAQAVADSRVLPHQLNSPGAARCLIVDDSVSVRRSTEQLLTDLGFKALGAGEGAQALAMAELDPPSLIITDLEMPGINGLELARAVRSHKKLADVPIIMITSRQSEKHEALAMQAGVTVFMTKPVNEDELASQISKLIEPSNDG